MENQLITVLRKIVEGAQAQTIIVGAKTFKLADPACPVKAVATYVRGRIDEVVAENAPAKKTAATGASDE